MALMLTIIGLARLTSRDEFLIMRDMSTTGSAALADSAGTAARVRAVLVQALGTAETGVTSVARRLTVHPRALQRRLAAEGTTFAALLDDVRREATHRYLTTTDLPMSRIAQLVDLAEQAVLTRCCRRWWGLPPTAVRRAGPAAPRR